MIYPLITIDLIKTGVIRSRNLQPTDLRKDKQKLEAFRDRAYDFMRYWDEAGEDESLPDNIWRQLAHASLHAHTLYREADCAMDSIDEALEAWDKLWDCLSFVYDEVGQKTKAI